MKKLTTVLLLLLTVLSGISSANLLMIEMDSPIYDQIEDLYILEGKASPMGAKPWSEIDVQHLLDRITPVTEMGKNLKAMIQGSLSESYDEASFEFSASLSPQILVHTNNSEFTDSSDIWSSDRLDTSLVNLGLGFSYSENLALFMNVSLGTDIPDIEYIKETETDKKIQHDSYASTLLPNTFTSNIPFLPGRFDIMNFPNRAYFAAGYDAFRVYAGKDRMEWGNGIMGNMLLGDTLPYHNMFSLTFTGSAWFHYQMLIDFYTPFSNFIGEEGRYDRTTLNGIRFLLGHRFEFSLFSGKLVFALTDSIMYASENMYIDPQILNPMTFLHNGFIAGHSNSFAALEAEYAPINNLSIYTQIGVDDLAVPGEPAPPEEGSTANGIGVLAGLRYRIPSGEGYFHGNAEAVYTSPFMYHRATGTGEAGGYDFYFVSSLRYRAGGGVAGIFRYLSFPFGSDAIAGLINFGYKKPGVFDITANLFAMAHGVIDKFSVTSWYGSKNTMGDGGVYHTPSTVNPFDSTEKGAIEYTISVGADAVYSPLSYLDINTGLYFISKINSDNVAGLTAFDMQFSLGLKIYY